MAQRERMPFSITTERLADVEFVIACTQSVTLRETT